MKKTSSLIIFMLFLFALFLSLSSCITNSAQNKDFNVFNSSKYSFLKIRTYALIRGCKDDVCREVEQQLSSGSGFTVARDRYGAYVMTAGHICESMAYDAFKVSTEDKKTKVSIKFYGYTIDHKKYELHTVKVHKGLDLCMMYSVNLKTVPLPIAVSLPAAGERIYNIAAPKDIMHMNAPIMIDGFYSGRDIKMGADIYTMIVDHGSSGSPILNSRGEVIGLISMKNTLFDFISYSPPMEYIRYFIKGILNKYSPEPISNLDP